MPLRQSLGRSSIGGVFGREGDSDLDLRRGSKKEDSGTLTENWGVREHGGLLQGGL